MQTIPSNLLILEKLNIYEPFLNDLFSMSAYHSAFQAFLASPDEIRKAVSSPGSSQQSSRGGGLVKAEAPEAETLTIRKSSRKRTRRKRFESESSSSSSQSESVSLCLRC